MLYSIFLGYLKVCAWFRKSNFIFFLKGQDCVWKDWSLIFRWPIVKYYFSLREAETDRIYDKPASRTCHTLVKNGVNPFLDQNRGNKLNFAQNCTSPLQARVADLLLLHCYNQIQKMWTSSIGSFIFCFHLKAIGY